jgi:hypothetical protein
MAPKGHAKRAERELAAVGHRRDDHEIQERHERVQQVNHAAAFPLERPSTSVPVTGGSRTAIGNW